MKKIFVMWLAAVVTTLCTAQQKDFSYRFYGQVRTDYYYNSRANAETVDGLFYMYPLDKQIDANGKDRHGVANSNFYALYSRLGIDVSGPVLGAAKTSAKVEADFRGTGSSFSVVRLRHAYFQLHWSNSALLVGQTWHPLFGEVSPQILNLSVGAPFQPFSRAPQLRYRYVGPHLQLTAAAVWQSQYLSQGIDPDNLMKTKKSQEYLKKSGIPEFYLGVDYRNGGFLAGAGVELLSIKPRTETRLELPFGSASTPSIAVRVDERLTTLSYEVHAKYSTPQWFLAAKSVLGANLTQTSGLGGFGVKSIDLLSGEQQYTPIRFSSSWVNVVYGKRWKSGLFVGYAKNLGTPDELVGPNAVYGTGTHIDRLLSLGAELTYNVPHWRFGMEYMHSTAHYGSIASTSGKVVATHGVSNHRLVATAIFLF